MAVWHNENDLMTIEVNARGRQDLKRRGVQAGLDFEKARMSAILPGCACGSLSCCLYGGYFSFICCLCTAGTSVCCYYCFCLEPFHKNAESWDADKLKKATAQDLKVKVRKSVRENLLDGPSDKLKLNTKELQAPGVAHVQL